MKSKSRKIISAALIVVLFFVMLFIGIKFHNDADGNEPEYVLSFAATQAENYPTTIGIKEFARLVENRTDGRIKIVVKSDAWFGSESDVMKQLQCGGIDIASISTSQLTTLDKRFYVLEMPYLFKEEEHLFSVLDSEIGNGMLALLEDNELIGVEWLYTGSRNFFSSTPIDANSLILHGRRMRVVDSDLYRDLVVALDGEPVNIDVDRIYTAIGQGDVDGAEGTLYSYNLSGYYEVAPNLVKDGHILAPEVITFSKNTWQKLSLNDRKIIMECAEEASNYERQVWDKVEEEAIENLVANGVNIEEINEDVQYINYYRMMDIYNKYAGENMDLIPKIHNFEY